MSPPLKVLIIHNDYQQPGGETAAVDAQIALLRGRGHSVVLYGRANDEIRQFSLGQRVAFFPQALYSRRTYRELRELTAKERPDLAHVHNVFPLISPSAYLALRDSAIPIVQTVHNFRLMCPNGLFFTHGQICERCIGGNTLHAVRWRCFQDSYALSALYALTVGAHRGTGTFGLIDRLVVPAEFPAAKLIESGVVSRDRVTVLNYFLPQPLPQPGSSTHRQPHVTYLGRLSGEKGIWTLLEAMRGLPQLGLKILGAGPLTVPIHEYLAREHVLNVEMIGFVSGEAKWNALRSTLAVVVPSEWYEISPFSVIESLAAGTAVVASNLGNFPEAVSDHETGLLFRAGDSRDLRDKLAWLADHPEKALAMGRRAREVAEARYSAVAHYDQLLGIYQTLVRSPRRPLESS